MADTPFLACGKSASSALWGQLSWVTVESQPARKLSCERLGWWVSYSGALMDSDGNTVVSEEVVYAVSTEASLTHRSEWSLYHVGHRSMKCELGTVTAIYQFLG